MGKQTITTILSKHGVNVLKIGAISLVGAIANQVLKGFTKDTVQEIARDIRRVKTDLAERKQAA